MEKNNISNFRTHLRNIINGLSYLFILIVIVAFFILGYILLNSFENPEELLKRFNILIMINIVLGTFIAFWSCVLLWRFKRYIQSKRIGAKLTLKLALSYTAMAVLPGLTIYFFSTHIMMRSVDSWFNIKVDNALTSGIILGQTALDTQLADALDSAKVLSHKLSFSDRENLSKTLNQLHQNHQDSDLLIFSPSKHQVIAHSSKKLRISLPSLPPDNIIEQVRLYGQYAEVEQIKTSNAKTQYQIRIIVPLYLVNKSLQSFLNRQSEPNLLELTLPVSEKFSTNMDAVQNGMSDYKTLELSRDNILSIYFVSLRLFLTLMVFFSIMISLQLAKKIVHPLSRLAKATHRVAQGHFVEIQQANTKDEIASLTDDFNHMVKEVKKSQNQIETQKRELVISNTYLENILSTLSSGVLTFDQQFNITGMNRAAINILGYELEQLKGHSLQTHESYQRLHDFIYMYFISNPTSTMEHKQYWSAQFELTQKNEHTSDETATVLLLKGTSLVLDETNTDYMLVIEDVTEVISANRAIAWAEVARRLAHEIKNPLTPIQLSIERLDMKLQNKLDDQDADMLSKTTHTIVNQVAALSAMVNDFRSLSQTKNRKMQPLDLNQLILEIAQLYGHEDDPTFMISLETSLPAVTADKNQIRQVLNNLLSNAQDATQHLQNDEGTYIHHEQPRILIKTALIEIPNPNDLNKKTKAVQLEVLDAGKGFSPDMINKAFEPYITTKAHGTGLGLSIVKKIIEEHGGLIHIGNHPPHGARVSILFKNIE